MGAPTARQGIDVLAAAVIGYVAGSIPFARLGARLATGGRVDLLTEGSGNPGGANAAAVLGRRWGYAVMAADVAKAVVACRLGRRRRGDLGQHVAGTAAVIGHCYPAGSRLRGGGKGVACSAGQCLATFPAYFPFDLAVAGAVTTGPWRHRAATATAMSSMAWVVAGVLWWRRKWPNAWGGPPTAVLPVSAAVTGLVIHQRFRRSSQP